jgi:hypothetical protein
MRFHETFHAFHRKSFISKGHLETFHSFPKKALFALSFHSLTHLVFFQAVTRPLVALLLCLLFPAANAAAFRVSGIPSTRQVVVIPVYTQIDSTVKLPPPPVPNLGTGAWGAPARPADIQIERDPNAAPAPTKAVETPAPAEKQKPIASEARLNHNALMWQLERAQAGSSTAMRSIGMRYLTGDGLEKNEAKAREWLKKGAAGGDSAAVKELARLDAVKEEKSK